MNFKSTAVKVVYKSLLKLLTAMYPLMQNVKKVQEDRLIKALVANYGPTPYTPEQTKELADICMRITKAQDWLIKADELLWRYEMNTSSK